MEKGDVFVRREPKRRRVSCVRDFPLAYPWYATTKLRSLPPQGMDLVSKEVSEMGSSEKHSSSFKKAEMATSRVWEEKEFIQGEMAFVPRVPHQGDGLKPVKLSSCFESNEIHGVLRASGVMHGSVKAEPLGRQCSYASRDSYVPSKVETAFQSHSSPGSQQKRCLSSKNIALDNRAKRNNSGFRLVSAKRDFPRYVGTGVLRPNMKENGEADGFSQRKKDVREISDGKDEIIKENVKQTRQDVEDKDFPASKQDGFLVPKGREQREGGDPIRKVALGDGGEDQRDKEPLSGNSSWIEGKKKASPLTRDKNIGQSKEIVDCTAIHEDPDQGLTSERQEGMVFLQNFANDAVERKKVKHDYVTCPRPVQNLDKRGCENVGGTSFVDNTLSSNKTVRRQMQLLDWEEACHLMPGAKAKNSCREQTLSRPPHAAIEGNSDVVGMRLKVRETLRLFQNVCRKLLREEEAKPPGNRNRVDLQAMKILNDKGKFLNTGDAIIGHVPGVEIGDEFHFKVELHIIGLHHRIMTGIDYRAKLMLATSVIASEKYSDALESTDILVYMGQGGHLVDSRKEATDQKLETGNLALVNSMQAGTPVRVIRGDTKYFKSYVYDGLYLVEEFWKEMGPRRKQVFKFRLRRIPGQPEVARNIVKKSRKLKVREGLRTFDISQGKEKNPISVVNTIDGEKPLPFTYTTRMKYPYWCRPPRIGCLCKSRCWEAGRCSCLIRNNGLPYNHDGGIVEAKPIIYECGQACKCPPSCYNRVSQQGIRYELEVFRTRNKEWGLRSLDSIPSGSFICEYIGVLLDKREAKRGAAQAEYTFDIRNTKRGANSGTNDRRFMEESMTSKKCVGFTIDASWYGNVGRFIRRGGSPNVYAQHVLYDHEDWRIPHIVFFAMDNIPPLRELTYDYA